MEQFSLGVEEAVNLSHSLLLRCKNLNSKLEKEKETQTFLP